MREPGTCSVAELPRRSPLEGAAGGRLVAEGPPEKIAKAAASHTGRFLARTLEAHPKPRVA